MQKHDVERFGEMVVEMAEHSGSEHMEIVMALNNICWSAREGLEIETYIQSLE